MTSDRIHASRNAQDRVARSVAMLLLVLFSAGNVLAQTVNFARDDYAAYAGARAIASADFNRDGSPDLALATNAATGSRFC